MTDFKLPADVLKFLFDKYYNWEHKKDSEWAKELLVKYGALSDADRRLPADVRWFLSQLVSEETSPTFAKSKASDILGRYPSSIPEE